MECQDYVRRVLLAIPASNMKADKEDDAEKQERCGVEGSGFRVKGLGFRVKGSGFRV